MSVALNFLILQRRAQLSFLADERCTSLIKMMVDVANDR